jgi:hypothetical protein
MTGKEEVGLLKLSRKIVVNVIIISNPCSLQC